MSLIHSAELNGVELFEYLIELLKNPEEVRQDPAGGCPGPIRLRWVCLDRDPTLGDLG